MDDDFAHHCGVNIARDCIQEAQGLRTLDDQDYVDVARERCGVGSDRGLAFVLDELERRADAGELETAEALSAFACELKQDVPDASRARALLTGLEAGAKKYGGMGER